MPTLSSLVVAVVVIMITASATIEDYVGIMTTLCFQCNVFTNADLYAGNSWFLLVSFLANAHSSHIIACPLGKIYGVFVI